MKTKGRGEFFLEIINGDPLDNENGGVNNEKALARARAEQNIRSY